MIRSVCLAGLLGLAGCVIDSKVDEINLDLPEQQVIVDTGTWKLTDEGRMPAVECAGMPGICADRVDMWCGAEDVCQATCGTGTCEIEVAVALWNTINLEQEATQLAQLDGQPLQTVTIDEVTFTVSDNTLNVPSPPLTVSVAPSGVMSVGGRNSDEVGVIPALEPGQTVGEEKIELTPAGQSVLSERMRDYQTPFNLVVGSTVTLRAGEQVPSGRLKADLKVSAHANTGL
ncbi:MAG TPA: hypothetical protein VKB80_04510 [Kofleriaceae bacterium]|nr:hypothetical protein [Kofleriaceae bacterium]